MRPPERNCPGGPARLTAPRRALGVVLLALAAAGVARAADETLLAPAHVLIAEAPAWRELATRAAQRGDTLAAFEEQRFFPFRKEPVVLRGEVRVAAARGLSLHYLAPDERTVIIDDRGVLIRERTGRESTPGDARANAANDALRHVLRFDFPALAKSFEIFGRREGARWSLALVPRTTLLRQAVGTLWVDGEEETVRRIELRRSAKQHIDITMSAPRAPAPFSAEETQRYFR